MKIKYVTADPTGNITALVEPPIAPARQPDIAALIMAERPEVEQVGFLSSAPGCHIALRMAGGEFCGNAAMSAAALFVSRRKSCLGEERISVRVSGAPRPVTVSVFPKTNGYAGCVGMPLPSKITSVSLPLGGTTMRLPVVILPGISHVIVPASTGRGTAESAVRSWCERLQCSALGLMLLDENMRTLTPLVYVPGSDTMFWERSCASGTAAAGAWLSEHKGGDVSISLLEPGGRLSVEARRLHGRLYSLHLGGNVRITGENILETANY